jgi:hypothetical protein
VKEFRNPPTGPEEREKLGQRRISQRVAHGSHLLADGLQKGMISHLCKTAGVRIAPEYRELIRERIKTGRTCNGEWRQVWPSSAPAAGETLRAIAESYGVHIGVISRLSKAPQNRISDIPTRASGRDSSASASRPEKASRLIYWAMALNMALPNRLFAELGVPRLGG